MSRSLILLLLCAALSACAATPPREPATAEESTAAPAPAIEPPERHIPQESLYPLLLAEFALRRREYDVAMAQYREQAALLRDPAVSAHTTHLAQFLQREDEALEAVRLWVELEPDNVEANNTLATLLARKGQTPDALPHLAVVARAGRTANFPILLNGFGRLSPADQSRLVGGLGELAAELPDNVPLLIARALVDEELGQPGRALAKLEQAIKLDPEQQQAILLEARLLLEQGHKHPFARLERTLEAQPDNQRLRLQYARLLTQTDMEAARAQFEILSAQAPRDGDLLFSLALINREMEDHITARAYLRQLLDLGQRVDEAHYYLGRSYEDEGKPKDAAAHYLAVEDGREFLSANRRLGLILLRDNQIQQCHAMFGEQRRKHPHRVEQLYAVEVDLLSEIGRSDAAMAVLNAALKELPESTPLQYTRSMLGEQQNNLALMESDLRAIIAREPDNATALNALGYTLANRTDRYQEAYELISRALQLAPGEPAILDSMGWVNFRLGNYETAIDYLERAYAAFPDPEVAAHLGEALWMTGREEAAMAVWRKALAQDAEHAVLRETLQRLGVSFTETAH
jgi:tetratricopeptide (TPR) repeat protein